MKKGVVILGSTGSVGNSALEVLRELGDQFEVVGLAARSSAAALEKQAREWKPRVIALEDESRRKGLARRLEGTGIEVLGGKKGVATVARAEDAQIAVAAIVGLDGLGPAMEAAGSGKRVAIASKEAMVAAGDIIASEAARAGGELVPVDSEPCAIAQCLRAGERRQVRRLILTASGGPFYRRDAASLAWVKPEEALAHPVWKMGRKVTVDSSTLMNKGLEVIEIHRFFDVPVSQIEVLVHPQSIVHSMVEFVDGATMALMGPPDMRSSIQYALTGPDRVPSYLPLLELADVGKLEFETPDVERFPCLRLAYEAAEAGGTMPAVLSAADEVAVHSFLAGDIGFLDIAVVVRRVMERHQVQVSPGLDTLREVDRWARERAAVVIQKVGGKV